MADSPAFGTRQAHLSKRVGSYLLGRTIGEGTYAEVKYGQHVDTGDAVAIKVLDKEALVRGGMVEQIKREITILQQIRHPHIVNLLEVMSSKGSLYMVLELVAGGELFDRVVAQGPLKEPAARRMFGQLLDAVGYCHQQGVYHRDLKPENVLLTSTGAVKLSDFGLGALAAGGVSGGDALLRTTCGTPNYVAPEVLAKRGYRGGPADIWSLGVVLYVMLAGCLPFDEDDLPTLFAKVATASYEVPPWLSQEAAELLATMLNPSPDARPTAEQVWSHRWMRSGLARRSMVAPPGALQAVGVDFERETSVETEAEVVRSAYAGNTQRRLEADNTAGRVERRANAFELINSGLDISALLELREELVARHTRFSSRAPPTDVAAAIEAAAVAVGGTVERQGVCRLRLHIPNLQSPGGALLVRVELVQVAASTIMADLQKVKGSTAAFYSWYADLTQALSSIISRRHSGAEGVVGAAAAAAARRQQQEAGGRLRSNAFELVASCFNVGALLEEEQATSRHVQFSSRRPPAQVLEALEAAAADIGGSAERRGEKRALLTVPVGAGRTMRLQAHLFEVLSGVHVCQIEKDAGSSMDFMRVYARLATALQPLMMKQRAFPVATHAGQLLAPTASMNDGERHAVQALVALAPASSSYEEASASEGGSRRLDGPVASLEQQLDMVAAAGDGAEEGQQAAAGSGDPGGG